MTKQEYEQKKRECWEEFKNEVFNGNISYSPYGGFDFTFDRAYALGKQETKQEIKQETKQETVISGWVARDSNESLYLFCLKPERVRYLGSSDGVWMSRTIEKLDPALFPDLSWESDPIEVELIIKRKKNGKQ